MLCALGYDDNPWWKWWSQTSQMNGSVRLWRLHKDFRKTYLCAVNQYLYPEDKDVSDIDFLTSVLDLELLALAHAALFESGCCLGRISCNNRRFRTLSPSSNSTISHEGRFWVSLQRLSWNMWTLITIKWKYLWHFSPWKVVFTQANVALCWCSEASVCHAAFSHDRFCKN